MEEDEERRKLRSIASLRAGVVTCAALLLSFAALDDITTGNETSFTLEYAALLITAGWLLFVTFGLIRSSRRVLGAISFALLAGAVWGQRQIGPGIIPGLWPAYVVTVSAFLWFLVIAIVLLVSGWRSHPEGQAQTM